MPAAAPAIPVIPLPPMDPGELAGQTLGAYQLLRKLADGHWGSIYAGVQVSINRPVAIEILDTDKASDDVTRERFIADARAKAQVQHPSILAVYEAGEADGRFFYAHEFVDGGTLADLKASGQRLDEVTALKVLRVASEGLAYLTVNRVPHHPPEAASISVGHDGQPHLANLATHIADGQLAPEQEIQALGRIMLSVLPAIQSLTPGLRDLLKGMFQNGPGALTSWGAVLQGIKAIEPKVVPVEAAKISAQDRAAIAAVEQARKQQKRTLYISIGSVATLLVLIAGLVWWLFGSNERSLDEQVDIPAGEFLFANGESKTLPEFWIDKYEVTYGQYAKFVKALEDRPTSDFDDPRQPRIKTAVMHKPPHWIIYYTNAVAGHPVHGTPIDLNCPVMEVDYWDAYAYAKWKGRELPTEEEWEKAGRGLKGFKYPWGEEFDPKNVNSGADYDGNDPSAKGKIDGYNFWNPVDKIKGDKSPFGVIGMAGNVREWTGSWDPAKKRPVIKGGSFMSTDVSLDQRAEVDPNAISEGLGFRTVSHSPPVKK
jgi:formylglycine-generating enzyme required for sulfatase activity